MSTPNLLHQRAMEAADEALAARARGEVDRASILSRRAFEDERAAALLVADDESAEPSRSVLLRSAATLAVECGELREAERLIGRALAGNPPAEIAEELRDLLEQVNFGRHLNLRGLKLSADEFQMSLTGDAVGFGIVEHDELLSRANSTRTLLFRTAERRRGRSFREKGPIPKSIRDEFEVYLSVPRAASMAVSFKVGSLEQIDLPGMGFGEGVIDEFITCLELVQESPEPLRKRISDEAYYRNLLRSLGCSPLMGTTFDRSVSQSSVRVKSAGSR